MIQLSLQQCRNFKYPAIDYETEAQRRRTANKNEIIDLVDLYLDPATETWLETASKSKNTLSTTKNQNQTAQRILIYYNNYVAQLSKTPEKEIAKYVKAELKALDVKINNSAKKWQVTVQDVKNSLAADTVLRASLAKDLSKQTFHQHFAAGWYAGIPFVENFFEPNNNGTDAWYVDPKGGVFQLKKDKQTGKSIDFIWEYTFNNKTLKFYATHKHTDSSGGAQDNQYNDVQEFHESAKSCMEPDIVLLSITDGSYYLKNEASVTTKMTKLQYLNSGRLKGDRNLATNSDNFAKDVVPKIVEWLEKNFDPSAIKNEIDKLNLLKDRIPS